MTAPFCIGDCFLLSPTVNDSLAIGGLSGKASTSPSMGEFRRQ